MEAWRCRAVAGYSRRKDRVGEGLDLSWTLPWRDADRHAGSVILYQRGADTDNRLFGWEVDHLFLEGLDSGSSGWVGEFDLAMWALQVRCEGRVRGLEGCGLC